jgi:hypothetical protein
MNRTPRWQAVRARALAAALVCAGAAALPCAAQTSASYKLTEATLNGGGNPNQVSTLASPHYHIKLDAIGDGVIGAGMASSSFHSDAGFVADYPPPGEVSGVTFTSKTSLTWNGERSVGTYDLYRDALGSLPGAYGSCYQSALPTPSWTESASPAPNTGWFYLVTAENRLRDHGTKGFVSGGAERSNSPACP